MMTLEAWRARAWLAEEASYTATKRALDAEDRLAGFYNRLTDPPITILRIDYKERWEKACASYQAELRCYKKLLGRLYWRCEKEPVTWWDYDDE